MLVVRFVLMSCALYLLVNGAASMLVPLPWLGRLLRGGFPVFLGLASLACALWLPSNRKP